MTWIYNKRYATREYKQLARWSRSCAAEFVKKEPDDELREKISELLFQGVEIDSESKKVSKSDIIGYFWVRMMFV
ncbi:MAG: hypothetical protein Q7S39_01515 [Ignavibacteria bacterium]|nr:hypothetical protein [Ignavibacteria bacterium]